MKNLILRLFAPAIALSARLTYTRKFLLFGALYLMVIAVLLFTLYSALNQTVRIAQRELDGVELSKPLLETVQLIQKHRGLEAALLNGDMTLQAEHNVEEAATIKAIRELVQTLPEKISGSKEWHPIKQSWALIEQSRNSGKSEKSFAAHTRVIELLQALIGHIADDYGITGDPDTNTFYLLNSALEALPDNLEQIEQIRAVSLANLSKRKISAMERVNMHKRIALLRYSNKALRSNLKKTAHFNPSQRDALAVTIHGSKQATQQIIQLIEKQVLDERFTLMPRDFYNGMTDKVDVGYRGIFVVLLPAAEAELRLRVQRAKIKIYSYIGLTLIAVSAVQYLLFGIFLGMRSGMRALSNTTENFSQGHFDQPVVIATKDELNQIGASINRMGEGFKALIQREQESAKHMNVTMETMLDAFVGMDSEGRIIEWNRQAKNIFGWTREEAMGKILHDTIMPTRYCEVQKAGMKHYMATGIGRVLHKRIKLFGLHRDGHEFPIELTISPIFVAGKLTFSAFLRDISERNRVEEALRNSERQARATANELSLYKYALDQHVIVSTSDVTGCITYANDKFCKISGYSREEVIGQNHRIINSKTHPPEFFREMYRTITRGTVWSCELCNRAKDGNLYWVDTSIVPAIGENGKPTHYIYICTDITKRKLAEEAAISSSRAKSEFLANMSHEIRTPMNGVIGMVDVLQQTELSLSQQRMVRTIQDSSLALLHILNDILDLSKIDANKLKLEHLAINLREIIESVAQLMYTTVNSKLIRLYVFISPELPQWVMSDPMRLRQMLLNLLGNAIKFTRSKDRVAGRVELRAEHATLSDGRSTLRLRVIDNGIGMNQETLTNLFQPFCQADASTSRQFGGTGLGLSITQQLVQLMDGQIDVHSMPNEGTEFCIALPLIKALPAQQSLPEPDVAGVGVLAVSDNVQSTEILTAYCQLAGIELRIVTSLAAASKQLQHIAIDAMPQILMLDCDIDDDHKLTLPDGVRMIQMVLRGQSVVAGNAVPVYTFPLLYHDLLYGIAIASGRMTASASVGMTECRRNSRPQASSIEQASVSNCLILLAEDNETNREVMQEQLRLLGYTAEIAEDGDVALEMWRANRYALLLTDCHMPKMDGFELTAAIRAEEQPGKHLPIIAVTANAMQGEALKCVSQGMDDYLPKPLRLDELDAMLSKWLSKQPAATLAITKSLEIEAKDATSIGMSSIAVELPILDRTTLTQVVGDNSGLHQRLLKKFQANMQKQSLAILTAAASGDYATTSRLAHSLKSAARTVGAMQLGELCQEIETTEKDDWAGVMLKISPRLKMQVAAVGEKLVAMIGNLKRIVL